MINVEDDNLIAAPQYIISNQQEGSTQSPAATSRYETQTRSLATSSEQITKMTQTADKKDQNFELEILKILFVLFNSFILGFLFEKSKVFAPEVIQGQMTLNNWRMMKFILMFIGSAQLLFGFSALASPEGTLWFNRFSKKIQGHRTRNDFEYTIYTPNNKYRGPIPIAIGSVMVGAGMAIAGISPGTIYAQAGTGLVSGALSLAGAFLGSFLFVFIQRWLVGTTFWTVGQRFFVKNYGVGGRFYALMAIPFSLLFMGLAIMLNFVATTENGFDYFFGVGSPSTDTISTNILIRLSWSPLVSGTLAGALVFFPSVLIINKSIGYSLTYPAFLAPLLSSKVLLRSVFIEYPHDILEMKYPSFKWFRTLVPALGVFLGALASSLFSRSFSLGTGLFNVNPRDDLILLWSTSVAGRVIQPIIGGFLTLFGARLAGGGIFSHGITGVTFLLSPSILVAVPAMLIGGVVTGVAMKVGIWGYLFQV